jgi:N-acetylmuramoyl-L-alanine amidase
MRVAAVVGHDEQNQGAYSLTLDVAEWAFNVPLAAGIVQDLEGRGAVARIFERPAGVGYSTAMATLTSEINKWSPDLVVSLHFNSMGDTSFSGCCVLHWPSSVRGNLAAAAISEAVGAAVGNRNRGAVAQADSWSGAPLYILRDTSCPAVIVESFFGSNPDDATKGRKARDSGALAAAIAGAAYEVVTGW